MEIFLLGQSRAATEVRPVEHASQFAFQGGTQQNTLPRVLEILLAWLMQLMVHGLALHSHLQPHAAHQSTLMKEFGGSRTLG